MSRSRGYKDGVMTRVTLSREELTEIKIGPGETLHSLSQKQPVLLVFLRHFGCVFCQESLYDIGQLREEIGNRGHKIILVHMEENEVAEKYLKKYGLDKLPHISDPDCLLYQKFGLVKGSFSQLFGLQTLARGFKAGMSIKQFGGAPFGDAFQMPGIFVINEGKVEAQFVHQKISDRPDYLGLLDRSKVMD